MKKLFVLMTLMLSFSVAAVIDVYDFETEEQEALFRTLTAELRCPKCQNNNLADSNASIAKDMRQKTYNMVIEGQDEDQIVTYWIDRFGNFVLYKPPVTLGTAILWVAPGLFVLFGGLIIVRNSRRKVGVETDERDEELSSAEKDRLAKILKDSEK
ncbi:cytochrome c-type biogenesis protein [Moritella viscosa]|uniref:Cytochrome c-type biogenesis protein n=1 Tax=Moritella viscosa TaxID=80854 RepID=A0ABY1HDI4_9GAMM|nr:cytochrome c-type biogenesis protein [Moritella viscosa]CED61219.1 cytochrome c-type biogenesis protein CcmH precursor [Moritella viscosa]SGY88036.1 Putative cytochrome c-type biogenesis protein [Moritella viscosa]SGY91243.1 Putative cytochrome c-type biogenesis protein [Moritella viscosa]SGY91262.1 Putative cytochrome c-type biogenesis protein [Moritella viscosa]SGY94780.1 Putative cytochrome c-type biogenesis protein [Moritella viscosa]